MPKTYQEVANRVDNATDILFSTLDRLEKSHAARRSILDVTVVELVDAWKEYKAALEASRDFKD